MTVYAYIVAGAVLLVGIAGIATSRNLVHAVVSLSVAQSATYILLIAVGYQNGGLAPIFGSQVGRDTPVVDPVVQALTLTDIVVSAAVTSMLLALVIQMAKRRRAVDPDDLGPLKG
ncbi:multicomponent Na+:H+ antiporter subunit C [Sinomonas atrocyanea]|jgi:multicomponent Na+:H+ antiporter subunit C|uniref:sodium:proton antiporter n=1 Tax=Sinomonas atrocyanea TaxID=37927 RepID=UPI002789C1E7|nr:cation:proton antiporter subunit C [Sinomonas atrocyanea]MDP9882671.1 multicomponent Na+:H+ antiporter subunit C [Sinomonas atrocyanea]